jgi:hypothetical protein
MAAMNTTVMTSPPPRIKTSGIPMKAMIIRTGSDRIQWSGPMRAVGPRGGEIRRNANVQATANKVKVTIRRG